MASQADFATLCHECKVPADFAQVLRDLDFDVASFAFVATSIDTLDEAIQEIQTSHSLEAPIRTKAALRLLWTRCAQTQEASKPSTADTPTAADASSWSEAFPPKLKPDTLRTLKQGFEANYPSEILDTDNTPGPRMLAQVYNQIQKKEFVWIPWKFRLSQKQHEDTTLHRPRKLARVESLSLHEALIDDVPSRDIPAQVGPTQLRHLLALQSTAYALCKACHLATLKLYERKFTSLATARFDSDTNLRPPNAIEMQTADQKVWAKIFELANSKGWSLDDAIHEFVEVRSELDALLQPRPFIPRSTSLSKGFGKQSSAQHKGKVKGKGKGTTGKSTQPQWVSETMKDNRKYTICMRFNQGLCQDPRCRYLHVCAMPKPNGQACGGNHSAQKHTDTPH